MTSGLNFYDQEPSANFKKDVEFGLSKAQKSLHPKYFYDQKGSELFEEICLAREYYPTRTETKILQDNIREIGSYFSNPTTVIEFGSGSSTKTKLLLEKIKNISDYLPIDISKDFLLGNAQRLAEEFPQIKITAICADYLQLKSLPQVKDDSRRMIFFPGSTLGNLEKEDLQKLFTNTKNLLSPQDRMLIGYDLIKEKSILERAYNDSSGTTAAFNLNLLNRINRELSADFSLERFAHHAFYCESNQRIEMHLKSLDKQNVNIDGKNYAFEPGETIHTENCYKFDTADLAETLAHFGFQICETWTDVENYFAVSVFEVKALH